VDSRLRASNHFVIQIGLSDPAQVPAANPLYLDGVRVFFTGGARIQPD
jgi:hypothetical protein